MYYLFFFSLISIVWLIAPKDIVSEAKQTRDRISRFCIMAGKPDSYAGFNEYNPLMDTDVSRLHFHR